jgi:hypothetical protein
MQIMTSHDSDVLWDLTLPLELIHVNRRRRRKPSVLRLPPVDCEIKERRACGHDGAGGKFCSKELETIGDTPSNGTANQSHCGCRTEHDPEFFGPEPTFRKKGRQERRGSSERTEKCAVEQHKSKQYAPVDSMICGVSRASAQIASTATVVRLASSDGCCQSGDLTERSHDENE